MATLHEITSDDAFSAHLSSLHPSTLLVLSFHTPWAAPCTQMNTVLSTLASTYAPSSPPSTSFISINAEELPDISEQYDVTAVPFVVLIRDGQVLQSISGSDAIKVTNAIEQLAPKSGSGSGQTGTGDKSAIPPALATEPRAQQTVPTTNEPAATNGTAPATQQPTPTKEELFSRLSELVKAASVMLFMKGTPSSPQCGFSRQIVAILRENGVKYGFFNILADEDVRQGLKEFADWPTFPQLWVRGELVGGLDIVKEEIAADPDFFSEFAVPKVQPAAS
ncbi:Grx4 family monothiol glutaredoxin [Polytolypa hystricis UAMH7299]|uniref:Grx4 family monothiol glutaredoxin n=1 Tax=Polytolypa hystricis (strain UAMH7299) TaxID=1447883 RepID=A0A2B7XIY4_POLH7|nr:Grx4 family monothiol glutaredoxin [Polytolypa hystricis UAMH7299]